MISLKSIKPIVATIIVLGLTLGLWIVKPLDAQAVEVKACPPERIGAPANEEQARLSVFTDLLGTWKGQGYNLIPLPVNVPDPNDKTVFRDEQNVPVFRVEAQSYNDEITFDLVGCVPNRGNNREDQFAKAISYHQKVAVDKDGVITPIHEENGMLLVLEPDASTAPDEFTIARLSSVPHGETLLAMGRHATLSNKLPDFPALDSRPIKNSDGTVDTNPAYFEPYAVANKDLGLTTEEILNPNLLLEKFVQDQDKLGRHVTQTSVVELSTNNAGAISNIPFLSDRDNNLGVPRMDFLIWIERVKDSNGQISAQLQYSQNTLLDFKGLLWPHIDVSSLVKQ